MKLTEAATHGTFATLISHALVADAVSKIIVGLLVAVLSTIASYGVKCALIRWKGPDV